jgi:thiamine kinase-like enzyme
VQHRERETEGVTIPAGDAVLSSEWLSRTLEGSPDWPGGATRVVSATRIGVDYGFSGRVHRVVAKTRGRSVSFVVKQDGSAQVERELLFRSHLGERLRDCIAKCFGGTSDGKSGSGVLVLEDVTPAEQGDVLQGCTHARAEAVVRALARVHGASWAARDDRIPPSLPRWRPAPMEQDRWKDRLERTHQRFPAILNRSLLAELHDLPEQVASAVEQLTRGPASWIHVDAHLDNVLWRRDGTAVLLDWCNAAIGPPAVDLARFFVEGVVDASQPEGASALMSTYAEERARAGPIELHSGFALALPALLQGAIGWAGDKESELTGRPAAVCESFLRSLCDWSRSDEYGLHVGRKGVA